jgi:cytochrome P450
VSSVGLLRPAASATAPRPLDRLPGPRGWPLLGNLPQIELPRMHAQLENWADRYGPVFRVRLGLRDMLVISNNEAIAALLRDRPDGWRRMQKLQEAIREAGSHGLFSAEGEDWRRQRRLVMSAFDPGHLKRYFGSMLKVTERLRQRLQAAAGDGEAIDLQAVLMNYSVDITAGLAFGIDLNTQQDPDQPLRSQLDRMFPMLMRRLNAPFPWWRYVRLPSDREFDRHLAQIHAAVRGFVQAARERMDREPSRREQPENLMEALIAAHDDDGDGLTEEELLGNVLTVLLGGEDTTANTLCWLLYLLHTHRSAWDEVVAEVDAALGGSSLPDDFAVARGLDFIEQCAAEAMRLRPVAPIFFMENNAPTVLEGVALPAGSAVICLMRRGAVDPGRAADAGGFRPDRWRPPGPDEAADGRGLLKASMPFGAGPRLCPGRYLAMLEIKMVIATLARNFELLEVGTADGAPPRERLEFTMYPAGLRMKLAPRGH